jgi:hypothetical protein
VSTNSGEYADCLIGYDESVEKDWAPERYSVTDDIKRNLYYLGLKKILSRGDPPGLAS